MKPYLESLSAAAIAGIVVLNGCKEEKKPEEHVPQTNPTAIQTTMNNQVGNTIEIGNNGIYIQNGDNKVNINNGKISVNIPNGNVNVSNNSVINQPGFSIKTFGDRIDIYSKERAKPIVVCKIIDGNIHLTVNFVTTNIDSRTESTFSAQNKQIFLDGKQVACEN